MGKQYRTGFLGEYAKMNYPTWSNHRDSKNEGVPRTRTGDAVGCSRDKMTLWADEDTQESGFRTAVMHDATRRESAALIVRRCGVPKRVSWEA